VGIIHCCRKKMKSNQFLWPFKWFLTISEYQRGLPNREKC
jgi:hypothetical protein